MVTPKELIARQASQAQVSAFFTDYMGIYSVKSFGAEGDGVTNDTDAFNSCINFATTNSGTAVYMPPGTYLVTSSNLSTNYLHVNFFGDNASFSGLAIEPQNIANPVMKFNLATSTSTLPNNERDVVIVDGAKATVETMNGMVNHRVAFTRDASNKISQVELLVNSTTVRARYTVSRSTVAGSSHLLTSLQTNIYELASTEIEKQCTDTVTRSSDLIQYIDRVVTT